MIVPTSVSQSLAAAVASESGRELAPATLDRFPDGELLAGVPGFEADRAVIVAATTSPEAHLELLQLQDAVREAGATNVTTVIAYLGYARQDKPMAPSTSLEASPPGYPISVRAMARAISTGTDRVLVVTPHESAVLDFFDVPATEVDATSDLASGLPKDLTDPLFVAPDEGALAMATSIRDAYGTGDVDHFTKQRIDPETVVLEPSETNPSERNVVIVDDIISTGGTASEAVRLLDERGAHRVYVTCVHAVLAGNARTKLARAGVTDIIATDTVEGPSSRVTVAPSVVAALEE